jgi:hypothetical protein
MGEQHYPHARVELLEKVDPLSYWLDVIFVCNFARSFLNFHGIIFKFLVLFLLDNF